MRITAPVGLIPWVFISVFSCNQIVWWRYGLHQPRAETRESILRFLDKHGFPNENIFVFKDSAMWSRFFRDSLYQKNVLNTLFYSPGGCLGRLSDTAGCPWAGGHQVTLLQQDTHYHADRRYTFQTLMNMVEPLGPETVIDTSGADYFAVTTWGTFLGKYNEQLFVIRTAAGEQTEVKVVPVFISLDFGKGWNLSKRQVEHYSLR